MMTVDVWLAQYVQVCENVLRVFSAQPAGYSDDKLASVEAAVEIRQEMLDELSVMEVTESDRTLYASVLETIKSMEADIEGQMKAMLSELDAQRLAVQDQRSELNRKKMANKSYAGMTRSTEGYFIDKKK